jgi:hypothetical protein
MCLPLLEKEGSEMEALSSIIFFIEANNFFDVSEFIFPQKMIMTRSFTFRACKLFMATILCYITLQVNGWWHLAHLFQGFPVKAIDEYCLEDASSGK